MGAVIMIMYFNLDENFIEKALTSQERNPIVIAPAEGLMLNKVGYEAYNEKIVD